MLPISILATADYFFLRVSLEFLQPKPSHSKWAYTAKKMTAVRTVWTDNRRLSPSKRMDLIPIRLKTSVSPERWSLVSHTHRAGWCGRHQSDSGHSSQSAIKILWRNLASSRDGPLGEWIVWVGLVKYPGILQWQIHRIRLDMPFHHELRCTVCVQRSMQIFASCRPIIGFLFEDKEIIASEMSLSTNNRIIFWAETARRNETGQIDYWRHVSGKNESNGPYVVLYQSHRVRPTS